MSNNRPNFAVSNFESIFDKIYTLESIIKLTLSNCQDKEITSSYYDVSSKNTIKLSEERNNYINMLTIALEKLEQLKTISSNLEISYNNTPTIAADK